MSDRDRSSGGALLGVLVLLGLILVACFPYFERTRNANEIPRLVQGMALWEVGNFAIDGPVRRRLDLGPDIARSPVDGRLYPNKPPGVSVLAAGAYAVASALAEDAPTLRSHTWWTRLLTGVVPTWLLAWFLLVRLSRGFGRAPAVLAVALYVLGSPAASYAHLAYGHQLAAALLTVGVCWCLDAIVAPSTADRRWVLARAGLGGAMAAAAVTVEYGAVFAGLPLGVMLLWRARSPARVSIAAVCIAAALAVIGLLAAYHHHAFGSVLSTGYHHVVDAEFARKHGQGLLGLGLPRWEAVHTHFFAADTGLLWWFPLAVLGVYGLAHAARVHDEPVRTQARVFLAIVLVYVVVTSSLSFEGGWRVGPRYLVVALPGLCWGLAEALGQIRDRPLWILPVVSLGMYQVVVNLLAANLWPHLDPTNIHHPVAEVLLPLWDEGLEPYGFFRSSLSLHAAAPVVIIGVVAVALMFLRSIELTPKTILAWAAGLLVAWQLIAATRLWPPHPRSKANLAYIKRVWEPRRAEGGGPPRQAPSLSLSPLSPEAVKRASAGPAKRR